MGRRDRHSITVSFCFPVGKTQGSDAAGPPKKKRKRAQKKPREQREKAVESKAQAQGEKPQAASQARKPLADKQERTSGSPGVPAGEEGQDAGQGQLGSMQTRSPRVIRKGVVRHTGVTNGGLPKERSFRGQTTEALGGWDPRMCTVVPGQMVTGIWGTARL